MRLRNVANAEAILNDNKDIVLLEPQIYKGRWHEFFKNDKPIHIEVGMGKGQFIINMALNNPDINYIGIEMMTSVIVRAVSKLAQVKLPNLILICADAKLLEDIFAKNEVDRIYLNFSDPWPKNRHEKRRLTHHDFLKIFETILIKNGEIHFKTDNQKLFEYSLVSMSAYNMLLKYVSLDLHNSEFENNIMTEYEEKFAKRNQRIYRLEAQYK